MLNIMHGMKQIYWKRWIKTGKHARWQTMATYLAKEWARARKDSENPTTPPEETQLLNLSKRLRIFTAEARNALYSEALLSAAQRWVWASSLASCRQFSKWAQFICGKTHTVYKWRKAIFPLKDSLTKRSHWIRIFTVQIYMTWNSCQMHRRRRNLLALYYMLKTENPGSHIITKA